MGASKKLWEEIRQKDLPDWINQRMELYLQEEKEPSNESGTLRQVVASEKITEKSNT